MRKIVCITPVKNEEWIIANFIANTRKWADKIIIADQSSSDNTVQEINRQNTSTQIVPNQSTDLNEEARKNLLLKYARGVANPIIFGLDSDELLTTRTIKKKIRTELEKLPKGTMIAMDWCNIAPDLRHFWRIRKKVFGYVDDKSSLSETGKIHLSRVPQGNGITYYLREISVAHLQYIDWARMKSKHRWYVYWERINSPRKHPIEIYRQYNHMYSIKESELKQIPKKWRESIFNGKNSLDKLKKKSMKSGYWWDKEIMEMRMKYGEEFFMSVDSSLLKIDFKDKPSIFKLLRIIALYLLFKYLKATQHHYPNKYIKLIDHILIKLGVFQ